MSIKPKLICRSRLGQRELLSRQSLDTRFHHQDTLGALGDLVVKKSRIAMVMT